MRRSVLDLAHHRSNRQDAEDAKKTDPEEISKALLGDLAVITGA